MALQTKQQMQAEVEDAVRFLVAKMDACALQDEDRAVFLPGGKPDPDTRKLGEHLHARWGMEGMLAVMKYLQTLAERMPWYKQGDVRELDCCWDGIGTWRS